VAAGPPYRYRATVLEALLRHGIAPRPATDPAKARELVSALYVFEIRELRARRRELERVLGPQPLDVYARQVEELKARYRLLELPLPHWVEAWSPDP
jgi:hypothetical protein